MSGLGRSAMAAASSQQFAGLALPRNRSSTAASSQRAAFTRASCSSSSDQNQGSSVGCGGRRSFLGGAAASAGLVIALPTLRSSAAEEQLSQWEKVPLPIDPGVVLLDLSFVPDEPNRGFLLGTRQTLLETKDGGRSWSPRSVASAEEEDFNYRFNSISFKGKEGWIIGKPAILLHTSNAGETWERIPLSSRLPGNPVVIQATGDKQAEMVTDEGAIYVTSNAGYNWKAAVEETVSATLNRTVSSGISGASYYTGTFNTVNRSPQGDYVAVSSRGNFYMTWEPGQPYWQPHNRRSARRIQNMGWRADGGLWLVVRGGGLYLGKCLGVCEDFEEASIPSRGFGILDLGYRSKDEAWAAGGSGMLLKTTDGGNTWSRDRVADSIAANLYSVKFLDNKKGFVLGNDGVLLRYLS
ncbi:photosystem II stability/assembly factor HCF136, chloroplastic [Selaginella moellendorffii]|nr:photosystem II stability/assembly factor HCF136, chloroplastic [Selaginella moellendorffii]|eukprot:XP_002966130.2 photosystem II stability/assembly factor HCF136, chloroplastic [Selaginella moellendorffii]